MAQAQEEENHWPGFVDALSTIVMVVTFLLIILAIAIFIMSLSIAEESAQMEDAAATSSNLDQTQKIAVADNPTDVIADAAAVEVVQSKNRFILQFSGTTIQIDDDGKARTAAFIESSEIANKKIIVHAYFDPSIAYTKAQRLSYYRLLATRTMLTDQGIAPDNITILVKEAPTLERIDAVEISLLPQ